MIQVRAAALMLVTAALTATPAFSQSPATFTTIVRGTRPAAATPGFNGAARVGCRIETLRVVVGPPARVMIDTPHAGNVLNAADSLWPAGRWIMRRSTVPASTRCTCGPIPPWW